VDLAGRWWLTELSLRHRLLVRSSIQRVSAAKALA
jgi:hypothetical protein